MKKEIIVDGKASDWFEKATFVLKEETDKNIPRDLFAYAEELVESYLKRFPAEKNKAEESIRQAIEKQERCMEAQAAYKLQSDYKKLKYQEKRLDRRAQHIHLFFLLSMGICMVSVMALGFVMIFH